MTSERFACGVDGGGTSTRVLIASAEGEVIGSGTSGSGNLHDIGRDALLANITEALEAAWAEAGQAPRPAAAAFCAMASVGTPRNREAVLEIAREVGLAGSDAIAVDIDLVAALAGGLGGGDGIALIAGTGSSCFGRDASGATFQSGGWGSLLDDVGSATWLGTQAMVAAIRDYDKRGPRTALRDAVESALELETMRELLPLIDGDVNVRARRASLAPLVTDAAEDGDPVARELLVRGADALAECVRAVHRTLDFGDGTCEVVVTGGLADGVPAYRELVHSQVYQYVPGAKCIEPRTTNARGAVLEALRVVHGGSLPEAVARNVITPPA